MASLEVHQFPILDDNYAVLVHDPASGATASIDAGDATAILGQLEAKGWKLTHILTTHHHGDHVGGNLALKERTGCTIIGPRGEAARIPGLDRPVGEGDALTVGTVVVRVLDTPGHTNGHISYVMPDEGVAFVGDTLFSLGCGRLLEGSAETMWRSLTKLSSLPPQTIIYCGHEYTAANARFAATIEPENAALQARTREIEALRANGKPTLPTTIGREIETNPFLRAGVPAIRKRLGLEGRPDWQVFAEIRQRKDRA